MKFLETHTDLFVPDACALPYDPDSSFVLVTALSFDYRPHCLPPR